MKWVGSVSSVLAALLLVCAQAQAQAGSQMQDFPADCVRAEWEIALKDGSLASVERVAREAPEVCPALKGRALKRAEQIRADQAEEAQMRKDVQTKIKTEKDAALRNSLQAELNDLNKRLAETQERERKATTEAADERKKRQAVEAQAVIAGLEKKVIACRTQQDLAKVDPGNIKGATFTDVTVDPEYYFMINIADVGAGALETFNYDNKTKKWSRSRQGARQEGDMIYWGGTTIQSQRNLTQKSSFNLNLATMAVAGRATMEATQLPNQKSAIDINGNTGQLNLNFDALLSRGPKAWVEARGNCAYRASTQLPFDLDPNVEWLTTSREIPDIPDPNAPPQRRNRR